MSELGRVAHDAWLSTLPPLLRKRWGEIGDDGRSKWDEIAAAVASAAATSPLTREDLRAVGASLRETLRVIEAACGAQTPAAPTPRRFVGVVRGRLEAPAGGSTAATAGVPPVTAEEWLRWAREAGPRVPWSSEELERDATGPGVPVGEAIAALSAASGDVRDIGAEERAADALRDAVVEAACAWADGVQSRARRTVAERRLLAAVDAMRAAKGGASS